MGQHQRPAPLDRPSAPKRRHHHLAVPPLDQQPRILLHHLDSPSQLSPHSSRDWLKLGTGSENAAKDQVSKCTSFCVPGVLVLFSRGEVFWSWRVDEDHRASGAGTAFDRQNPDLSKPNSTDIRQTSMELRLQLQLLKLSRRRISLLETTRVALALGSGWPLSCCWLLSPAGPLSAGAETGVFWLLGCFVVPLLKAI